MTFISYEQGSQGYQFWDKESRSVVISCDVKFDKSKFPNRKDLDYRNPFADKKRQSTSVKNWRRTTNESDKSDKNTEVGLVIPSTSNSDDDHRPSHPAPPPPGAPPTVPPKLSRGSKTPKARKPSITDKTLGQMKSLALLFLWNLIHKAGFSEVRDHSITCDPGSNWNNPKQVHHDSLKETHPRKDPVWN